MYNLKKKNLGVNGFSLNKLTFQDIIKNKNKIKNSAKTKNNIKISKDAHIPQIATVIIKNKK